MDGRDGHLVLPGDSIEKLRAAGVFASILGTNSHPGSQKLPREDVVCIAPRMVECLAASEEERAVLSARSAQIPTR